MQCCHFAPLAEITIAALRFATQMLLSLGQFILRIHVRSVRFDLVNLLAVSYRGEVAQSEMHTCNAFPLGRRRRLRIESD